MALVFGTNVGFCAVSPSADPEATTSSGIKGAGMVIKHTSPATATTITEMGWWSTYASTETPNYEVGLYAADGVVVPNEAGTLLEVERTNAVATGDAQWNKVTGLNWSIDSSTDYWLGVEVDTASEAKNVDRESSGGFGRDSLAASTLPDPFGGGALFDVDGMYCFYAVWEGEAPPPTPTYTSINIGDEWKSMSGQAIKINIGDAWKDVAAMKLNVADAWKPIVIA